MQNTALRRFFFEDLQVMHSFELFLPTRLVYGSDSIEKLPAAAAGCGKKVLIAYGGGSVKKTGLLDRVKKALADFEIVEFAGIEPNPRVTSVNAAAKLCREQNVNFVVAVGGGSVMDAAKAICAGARYEGDAWDLVRDSSLIKSALPLFTVLTNAATGSEYDAAGVITNLETNEKLPIVSPLLFPVASFCDPAVSVSVPAWHTAAGAADIMSHTFEQYLVMEGNDVSDGFCETILKTVIKNTPICIKDPANIEARAAMMLASSFGCCGLLAIGNTPSPWPCHGIEHEISAWHDITHGAGLAIITPHWMRYSLNEKTAPRFAKYAVNVWGMDASLDEMTLANAAIDKTAEFFASIGIPMHLRDVGVDESHFEAMADHIPTCWWPLSGALHPIDKAGVIEILKASL